MHRLTSALLLGGGVLLASYISAPAAPTPAPARVPPGMIAEIDALAPIAGDVAQQTDQLRARLNAPPPAPVARRDPFNFGAVRRPERPAAPSTTRAPEPESAPAIAWPSLVAVLTDNGDSPGRSAVFGVGDAVEILKSGASFGGFLVRDVTATTVELVHVATNTVTRLSIR